MLQASNVNITEYKNAVDIVAGDLLLCNKNGVRYYICNGLQGRDLRAAVSEVREIFRYDNGYMVLLCNGIAQKIGEFDTLPIGDIKDLKQQLGL